MARIGSISLIIYASLIYGACALLFPVYLDGMNQVVVRLRVIPGQVDALESTINWPIVAVTIMFASIIPVIALLSRFSGIRLVVASLVVSVIAEIFISTFLFWLGSGPIPQGYGLLSGVFQLNLERWPYEGNPHVVESLLRVGILPLFVACVFCVKKLVLPPLMPIRSRE